MRGNGDGTGPYVAMQMGLAQLGDRARGKNKLCERPVWCRAYAPLADLGLAVWAMEGPAKQKLMGLDWAKMGSGLRPTKK